MTKIGNRQVVQRGARDWAVFDASGDIRLGVVTKFDRCGIPPVDPEFYVASGTGRNVTFGTLEDAVAAVQAFIS